MNRNWITFLSFRYAAILFKKQRYVSSQHRMNIKIVCKDNFKYEVQERAATNAVSLQQLAEEYWRIDKFFLISFPILFFIFNIIYWLAFILWREDEKQDKIDFHDRENDARGQRSLLLLLKLTTLLHVCHTTRRKKTFTIFEEKAKKL